VERARALGATLGQGYALGRPDPDVGRVDRGVTPVPLAHGPARTPALTPFEAIAGRRTLRRGTKSLLLAISTELERQAAGLGQTGVLLASFQAARHFSGRTAARYSALAGELAFVGALGEGMGTAPAPDVRGADLGPGDPLCQEWDIAVVSPHFAAAFVARDLGDRGPESERRFDFALTHERRLALSAARLLMRHISPVGA
jgi:DICT domain-containing protein